MRLSTYRMGLSKEGPMKIVMLILLACGLSWGQECKPSSLNIPGAPYPCVYPDGRVTFRVAAPDAQKVQVRLGGTHDMTRGPDGLWTVTIPPQPVGFHYYSIVVDGAVWRIRQRGHFLARGGRTAASRFQRRMRTSTRQRMCPIAK